ncbi:hypothetical protein PR048_018927 [Dryococelus australis]|uniref:Uncharacterized protein n=1 Tax=Dryococelus australis TaxID=614101 RepID=A0ABQ9H261_9NEOP|nr:hypothetical protein PR048_018927 [Dryococelus australis]
MFLLQLVASDSEEDGDGAKKSELEFLKSLSTKQKRKLLKKLEKLEKKGKNGKSAKVKGKLKKVKKERRSSCSSSDSDYERKHRREKKVSSERVKSEMKRERCTSSSDDDKRSLEQVLGRSIKFEGGHGYKKANGEKSVKGHEHKRRLESIVSSEASYRKHARK